MIPLARAFYGPAFAGREDAGTDFHVWWRALNAALAEQGAAVATYAEACRGWIDDYGAEEWAGRLASQ